MYAVKILTSLDAGLFRNIAEGVFDKPVHQGLVSEFLADPRHHIVVAIQDDTMIGFASAVHYIHPDKPAELWMNEVGISPNHQRQGVAKAILKEMLRLGKRLGCVSAWVLTDRSNLAANRLYSSVGGRLDPGDTVMYEFDVAEESWLTQA